MTQNDRVFTMVTLDLVQRAERVGYSVVFTTGPMSGWRRRARAAVDYNLRRIWIVARENKADTEPLWLMALLAHEFGHMAAAERRGVARLSSRQRQRFQTGERAAYLFGWAALAESFRRVGHALDRGRDRRSAIRSVWRVAHDGMVRGFRSGECA